MNNSTELDSLREQHYISLQPKVPETAELAKTFQPHSLTPRAHIMRTPDKRPLVAVRVQFTGVSQTKHQRTWSKQQQSS